MAQGSREGGGVKTPKLKSKRERTAEEIRTMMRTDPVFRENFLKALPDSGVVWQIVRALLEGNYIHDYIRLFFKNLHTAFAFRLQLFV